MRLYLDDIRPTGARTQNPDSFDLRAYTAQEAIDALRTGFITHISLDHDLGGEDDLPESVCGNGYQVACWIEENVGTYNEAGRCISMPTWEIHSMNATAVPRMRAALESADRRWNGQIRLADELLEELIAEENNH